MNENKSDNKLSEIIKTSLDSIKSMVDANTVIGDPIPTANGTVILPVSKLMVGFASGGLDYLGKNATEQSSKNMNFGGGGGTGLTVVPVAFLVISSDGSVELLNINQPSVSQDPISQVVGFIENSPELIEKFKSVFSKSPKSSKDSKSSQNLEEDKDNKSDKD